MLVAGLGRRRGGRRGARGGRSTGNGTSGERGERKVGSRRTRARPTRNPDATWDWVDHVLPREYPSEPVPASPPRRRW